MSDFQKALESLINMYHQENESHTPDYILAEYIESCLLAFNKATRVRDKWWGFKPWAKDDDLLPAHDEKPFNQTDCF